ncbi:hypothetical protein R1sor_000997 [Riccia sorocarpa]|uniref:Uncharacterized protein n=1 Tax=Riccia sorocarpa TaxID=122646 RepID=A0ABD3GXY3_9MARC
MEAQVKQLREQVQKREAEIGTLKQHLALLTSDFKYNLKLLEDRDFELDQTEAQLEQVQNLENVKEKEMEALNVEIATFKATAERDAEQIRSLESTLAQYKESVRSVRQRLEEALQLRDQELSCHRSELESLKTKIQQQSESLKVQEKGLSDTMKACERNWSQRYSECQQTVQTLVAEQETLLKEKLAKDREMEIMQNRILELQRTVDELTGFTDESKKECTTLNAKLETLQERAATRLKELEQEKQSLEGKLRKQILEEYDGKIAELLAQLQSIEYAVSLERRESNTRLITLEAEQVEKLTSLHQTVQELRTERSNLLEKVTKQDQDLSTLRENLYHLKNNGRRLSQKEESLNLEVTTLQHALLEAKAKLEQTEGEKTLELGSLHDSLREARSREILLLGKEEEQMKRIDVLEQLLEDARGKIEHLSKKDSEENRGIVMAQEALEKTRVQLELLAQKSSEQVKEIAALKKSLTEARSEGARLSKVQADQTEELTILKQALYDARTTEEILLRRSEESAKDFENLRQFLGASKTQEEILRKKMDDQAEEILTLHDTLCRAKAEGVSLMQAEAEHAEEISVLRSTLMETQRQVEAATKHAQHLEAIIEVTQAESRRRLEIKECVSSLLTSAQEQQELLSRELSGSRDETRVLEERNEHMAYSEGGKVGSPAEIGIKTHLGLEEENRYLKARVEELQGENYKVGHVISELRNELETVGLLQPSAGAGAYRLSGPQKKTVLVPPLEEVNNLSLRPVKLSSEMTSEMALKNHQKEVRPNVVVDVPKKEDITWSEKEELQTLRALLMDVHNRNALFYKQVTSMSETVPSEALPERREEAQEFSFRSPREFDLPTVPLDRHFDSAALVGNQRPYTDGMRHPQPQTTIKPSTSINVTSSGLEPGLDRGEAKITGGVSAEVLKLNEQIARVRRQLNSLCSSEQSLSPGHKPVEVMPTSESRPAERRTYANEPCEVDSHDEKEAGKSRAVKGRREKKKGEFHLTDTLGHPEMETGGEKNIRNEPPGRKKGHHRKELADRYFEEPASRSTKSSPLNSKGQDFLRSTEVILPSKSTASKKSRTPARDNSLGKRVKVGRKIRMKIPSDSSSRSDVVCSHCQDCMSDNDSDDVSLVQSPKAKSTKVRIDPKSSILTGHGHASGGNGHRNLSFDRQYEYPARNWSDSDGSESTSNVRKRHNCTARVQDAVHLDRRKPSHKLEDKILTRREENSRSKMHGTREEHVPCKHSSSGRNKGLVPGSVTKRSSKEEKGISTRERVDINQARILA